MDLSCLDFVKKFFRLTKGLCQGVVQLSQTLWLFLEKFHTLHILEMCVLCPKGSTIRSGSCKDDAICQGQLQFIGKFRRNQRQVIVQIDNSPFFHYSNRFQRVVPVPIHQNALEYFEQTDRWDNHILRIFNCRCKKGCILSVDEILQPARRIYYVHTRSSSSRSISLLIPFKNPRASLMSRTGTTSRRLPMMINRTFCPGLTFHFSRMARGITI